MIKNSTIINKNINIFSNGCVLLNYTKIYDKKVKSFDIDFVMFQKIYSKEKTKILSNNKNIIYRKKLFK